MSKSRAELQAERDRIQKGLDALQETANAIDAELAELDAERKVWEPKDGEGYWHITSYGQVALEPWLGFIVDAGRLAANNCFPTQQAAERELLRRQSMKATIPVPKVGDTYWAIGMYDVGGDWWPKKNVWQGSVKDYFVYNSGRAKHTREECQAWIDQFGPAWTTVEDATDGNTGD